MLGHVGTRQEAPSTLYVDGGYISSEALRDVRQQGRELRGLAPASPDRGKVFTVEVFDIHFEERYALCAAGAWHQPGARVRPWRQEVQYAMRVAAHWKFGLIRTHFLHQSYQNLHFVLCNFRVSLFYSNATGSGLRTKHVDDC